MIRMMDYLSIVIKKVWKNKKYGLFYKKQEVFLINFLEELRQHSSRLEVPTYYYQGRCLPKGLILPDNILAFYSKKIVTAVQAHSRYLLVIPFSPVVYYVEQSRYELQPGNALFIKPWQRHWHQPGNCVNPADRLLITFELPSLQSYCRRRRCSKCPSVHKRTLKFTQEFESGNTLTLSCQLIQLLSNLAEHPVEEASPKFSPVIAELLRFINQHISEPLNIQTLAKHVSLSPSHLRMLFRKEMGESLGRYLAEQRLNIACNKLADGHSQVQEIARYCGYSSIYAFGHFFKNMTGMSPLAFRKHQKLIPYTGW